ncbi:hypothetical protein A9Q83_17645 [Alphaproteobacteria bacterium 46_93_T64]|nr:hypothetical protein A9Q83_17645 [Alphaproteobacteria bacterium 46_93_T64]
MGVGRKILLCGLIGFCVNYTHIAVAGEYRTHGLSTFGDLKYNNDFHQFDFVNPEAPKGGTIRLRNLNSFDSLNPFILKGLYDVVNADAGGDLSFNYASLMTRAHDEPDAVYGLAAKEVTVDEAGQWVTFHLRQGPTFHDGSPITAADIVYSFNTLKKEGHPRYRLRFQDVLPPTIPETSSIRFDFKKGARTRGLALQIGQMPILSEASFKDRPFNKTTMTPLLGSGPYKITKVQPGRAVTYERVKNHWAEKLPVHVGRYNFDRIQIDYYRDNTVALEAFFAGEYDFREEFTSRSWATEYVGKPAFDKGFIIKDVLKDTSLTGYQAFFFNTRREKFKDIRVRRAIGLMFDYEWTNKNLFYNSYERLTSTFENSKMSAEGSPSSEEMILLNKWKREIPSAAFGHAFVPQITNGSGKIRKSIRAALTDLKSAGWTIKNKKLVNGNGVQMKIEFLLYNKSFTRIINPFIRNLERVGIDAKIRIMDAASWQNRLQEFDFDITSRRFSQPAFPGVELRNWWGSKSADTTGGLNIAGVKNAAIDDSIEQILKATNRDELKTATRVLDRILMTSHYTIPQWFKASHFVAYWDKFGRPKAPKPGYDRAALHSWWYDTEKAAKLAAATRN